MKLNFFEKLLGSGFYTGYIPIASGTFASAAALVIYFIPNFEKVYIIIPSIIFFTVIGIFIGNKFEQVYGKDPSECTIDEVIGMWISLLFLPKNIYISIGCFLLWRILDIIKPYPARNMEKLKGGFGIIVDDVVSGIYSCLLMNIIVIIFKLR
jgi:phosphatidylglycerophosphatase A